jgi:hypothetical protein
VGEFASPVPRGGAELEEKVGRFFSDEFDQNSGGPQRMNAREGSEKVRTLSSPRGALRSLARVAARTRADRDVAQPSGRAASAQVAGLLGRLREVGYLLFADPGFESVAGTIAGSPIRGSWWGHPAGHRIYSVGLALDDSPDVLTVPLFFRKATLVHRSCWADVLAVAEARSGWQMAGLSPTALSVLSRVDAAGEVRVDTLAPAPLPRGRTVGDLARDLERRLLVIGRSVHTESGRHAKQLWSIRRWKAVHHFVTRGQDAESAARRIEERARALFGSASLRRALPWRAPQTESTPESTARGAAVGARSG